MRIRLIVMAIGLLGTLSVLVLVPRRGGWYSRMGAATLVVYLFHGFAIRFGEYAGWQEWSEQHPDLALPATTVAAIGLALFLASPPVRRILIWAVDPVNSVKRHRERPDPGGTELRKPVGPTSG